MLKSTIDIFLFYVVDCLTLTVLTVPIPFTE